MDLRTALTERVAVIDAYIAELPRKVEVARAIIAAYPDDLARAERDRAEALQALATLYGPPAVLTPRDVTAQQGLGLTVGGLRIAPHGATAGDLRLYAAVMRSLYQLATGQARQAVDMVNSLERRQGQALVETGAFKAAAQGTDLICPHCVHVYGPTVTPEEIATHLAACSGLTPACKHCKGPITRDGLQDRWYHPDDRGDPGSYSCRSGTHSAEPEDTPPDDVGAFPPHDWSKAVGHQITVTNEAEQIVTGLLSKVDKRTLHLSDPAGLSSQRWSVDADEIVAVLSIIPVPEPAPARAPEPPAWPQRPPVLAVSNACVMGEHERCEEHSGAFPSEGSCKCPVCCGDPLPVPPAAETDGV